ncbi:MAG: hypothetical protein GY765_05880 [bacterium]|nr:hypothetical protein [bacterium]
MKTLYKIAFIVLFILVSTGAFGEKIATVSEVLKPQQIKLDKENIYIVEGTTIHIYSRKDVKYKKKFGKSGEGPREFMRQALLQPVKDQLVINSQGKVSFFTKDGTFKKETKARSISYMFIPMKEGFVGLAFLQEKNKNFITVNMFNANLEKVKEIGRMGHAFAGGKVDALYVFWQPLLHVCKDRAYYNGKDGMVYCSDADGKSIRTIDPKVKKIKVTAAHEKEIRNFFATDARFKARYERDKELVTFPEHFPIIQFSFLADEKIYLLTNNKKDGKVQFVVLNLEGKELKRVMVPLHYTSPIEVAPFDISDGKIYQLVENEDEELEIHTIPI